jgi:TonB family protein
MSNNLVQAHDAPPPSDRRSYSRRPIRSLAYVELDEGNGGIVLNVSEGGLAVQAVTSLMDDLLPSVRFELSEGWVQARARITWTTESRKVAGLEFIDLQDDARKTIRDWVGRESPVAGRVAGVDAPPEACSSVAVEPAVSEASLSTVLDIDRPFVAEDPSGKQPDDETPANADAIAGPAPSILAWPTFTPGDVIAASAHPGPESKPPRVQNRPVEATPHPTAILFRNKWALVGCLAVLALASLAAGWAAGQGIFGNFLARVHTTVPSNTPVGRNGRSSFANTNARVAEIEVVNASNQRWTIPFDGPLDTPQPETRRPVSGNSSSQPGKIQTGFRTWIPAPPLLKRAANGGGEPTSVNPPVLVNAPASPGNILSQTGSAISQALAGAVQLRKPEPPPPTGIITRGQVIYEVDPVYPKVARDQRVEGTVRLNVTIGKDGMVRAVTVLGGPFLLVKAAEEAVRQWRYSPTLLDDKPIEVEKEVDLRFHFSDAPR